MKRISTAYYFAQAILFVVLIFLLPVTVWAQEITLTTVVPSFHTINLYMKGEGTVTVDGVPYEYETALCLVVNSKYIASLKFNSNGYHNDGKDGKSAYQIWLESGNSGTEEEYLASLKGEPGEEGKQGPQGEPGQDGAKGDDGIGVTAIIEEYYLSTSNTEQIGGE